MFISDKFAFTKGFFFFSWAKVNAEFIEDPPAR